MIERRREWEKENETEKEKEIGKTMMIIMMRKIAIRGVVGEKEEKRRKCKKKYDSYKCVFLKHYIILV